MQNIVSMAISASNGVNSEQTFSYQTTCRASLDIATFRQSISQQSLQSTWSSSGSLTYVQRATAN